jgi:hypothetical protein
LCKRNQNTAQMETSEKVQFEILFTKYLTWKSSQSNQTDGYEYEKSFSDFCEQFNKELFKLAVEETSDEKKKLLLVMGK